jgi:hypothetical protein
MDLFTNGNYFGNIMKKYKPIYQHIYITHQHLLLLSSKDNLVTELENSKLLTSQPATEYNPEPVPSTSYTHNLPSSELFMLS